MKLTVLFENTFLSILKLIPMVSGTILSSMTPREQREKAEREREQRERESGEKERGETESGETESGE